MLSALGGAAVAGGLFGALHVASPQALGFGDVRFATLIGLSLGSVGSGYVVSAIVLAAGAGAATGVVLALIGRVERGGTFAFGPFLTGGALVTLVVGPLPGA